MAVSGVAIAAVVAAAADLEGPDAAEEGAAEQISEQSSVLRDLAETRRRHQQRYRARELEARRGEQELRDAQAAEKLAEEEERTREEARRRQLEADEAQARALAEELNPGGAGQSYPLQDMGGHGGRDKGGQDDQSDEYHQLEDGEAEGYRRPMRTGYVDRLIDEPQASHASTVFPPLALLAALARDHARRGGGGHLLGGDSVAGDGLLGETGFAREMEGAASAAMVALRRCRAVAATAVPLVCVGGLFAALASIAGQAD